VNHNIKRLFALFKECFPDLKMIRSHDERENCHARKCLRSMRPLKTQRGEHPVWTHTQIRKINPWFFGGISLDKRHPSHPTGQSAGFVLQNKQNGIMPSARFHLRLASAQPARYVNVTACACAPVRRPGTIAHPDREPAGGRERARERERERERESARV